MYAVCRRVDVQTRTLVVKESGNYGTTVEPIVGRNVHCFSAVVT